MSRLYVRPSATRSRNGLTTFAIALASVGFVALAVLNVLRA